MQPLLYLLNDLTYHESWLFCSRIEKNKTMQSNLLPSLNFNKNTYRNTILAHQSELQRQNGLIDRAFLHSSVSAIETRTVRPWNSTFYSLVRKKIATIMGRIHKFQEFLILCQLDPTSATSNLLEVTNVSSNWWFEGRNSNGLLLTALEIMTSRLPSQSFELDLREFE